MFDLFEDAMDTFMDTGDAILDTLDDMFGWE